MPQALILKLLNMIHGSAESSFLLGNQNITYNNELWDSKHYILYNTSLSLTTTIVNLKILKNSNKNPTLPSGFQDSSQHTSESPDSLNLLPRISSIASKRVYFRERL